MKKSGKKQLFNILKHYTLNKYFIVSAIIVILLTIIVLLYFNSSNGLIRTKGMKVYYRVYTKEKGWSNWKQNGQIVGNEKYNIKALQIKTKSNYIGNVFYSTYSNKKWNENYIINGKTSGDKKHDIKGIKIMISDTLYKKYDFKYRLYTDYWSEWGTKGYEIKTKKPASLFSLEIIDKGDVK